MKNDNFFLNKQFIMDNYKVIVLDGEADYNSMGGYKWIYEQNLADYRCTRRLLPTADSGKHLKCRIHLHKLLDSTEQLDIPEFNKWMNVLCFSGFGKLEDYKVEVHDEHILFNDRHNRGIYPCVFTITKLTGPKYTLIIADALKHKQVDDINFDYESSLLQIGYKINNNDDENVVCHLLGFIYESYPWTKKKVESPTETANTPTENKAN